MKKPFFVLAGLMLTLAFYSVFVSFSDYWDWFQRFVISEKYLIITNGWVLSQLVFPHWGLVQIILLYGFASLGFIWCMKHIYGYLKKNIPAYRDHKQTILTVVAVVLLSFIIALILALCELSLRSTDNTPGLLIGETLTPSSTWKQQNYADEQGMNMIRADYEWNDTFRHVNKQGFFSTIDYTRSVADSLRKAGKKIVFVIGDSFVEGFNTGTWNHTFPELMKAELANKYAVFSFGIGGTDPLDYKLWTEKFIPEIKPDLCLICFCGNNDIMEFDRIATPHIPVCWAITNTFFYSNLYNQIILPSPDSVYSYLRKNIATNRAENKTLKWLCQKSQMVSLAYSYFHPWLPILTGSTDTCEASYRNLRAVQQICAINTVPFQIAFIPDKDHLKKDIPEYKNAYRKVFKELTEHVAFPNDFTKDDFGEGNDIHFNERGNRKFADFLEDLLPKDK